MGSTAACLDGPRGSRGWLSAWPGEAWEAFCEVRSRRFSALQPASVTLMGTVTARFEVTSPKIDQYFQNQKSKYKENHESCCNSAH